MTIHILHADDHPVVRQGVRALISTEPDMAIIASVNYGEEAVQGALLLRPDVILLDLHMPGKNGIQVIQEIKAAWPEANILVLTSFAGDDELFPAIQSGALGYLLKDSAPEELLQAIRDVYQGKSSLHASVALKVIQELKKPPQLPLTADPLTEREVEILQLVAQGYTNHDIAAQLVVSERTVRTHVSNILGKLHLANRTQAALYALRQGIARLNSSDL